MKHKKDREVSISFRISANCKIRNNFAKNMNCREKFDNVNRCKFGWEVDACGNKICTKGPGEVCGGKHMRYGICGEGLMCNNCNRCQVRYQKFFNFVNLTIRLLVLKIFNFNNFKAELLKKQRQ